MGYNVKLMHVTFYRCFDRLLGSCIINEFLNRMELFSKASHIKCTSRRKRVSIIGAMGEFDQNKDKFFLLSYFGKLDAR